MFKELHCTSTVLLRYRYPQNDDKVPIKARPKQPPILESPDTTRYALHQVLC